MAPISSSSSVSIPGPPTLISRASATTPKSHHSTTESCDSIPITTTTTPLSSSKRPFGVTTSSTTPTDNHHHHHHDDSDFEHDDVIDDDDDNDDGHRVKSPTTIKSSNNNSSTSTSTTANVWYLWSLRELQKWQRRIPLLKRMMDVVKRVPPRHRWTFVVIWILWKVIAFIVTVRIFLLASGGSSNNSNSNHINDGRFDQMEYGNRQRIMSSSSSQQLQLQQLPLKILYIVTSLTEYNTGARMTVNGQDRLAEVLLPVLIDSVDSMIHPPYYYQVDVYLILGFTLRPEREEYIRNRLPPGVGLQVWDDASPLGYDTKHHDPHKILDNTRALSRQHRYVIKDKLPYYDFFVAFEDDMRITGDHVHQFLQMSRALDQLRQQAPHHHMNVPENMDPKRMTFFGPMTHAQMQRLIPGFIRVEVLLNETAHGAQTKLDPIPLDYQFQKTTSSSSTSTTDGSSDVGNWIEQHLDPTICCHVHMNPNKETPVHPAASDVIIWETSVKALSVRQVPKLESQSLPSTKSSLLDWIVLLPGPGKRLSPNELVGGYWSGRDGAFTEKPSPGMPDLIAQQGGWMAPRDLLLRLQQSDSLCQGSFLPPFDEPMYFKDGQESMNVEFWSGGYQFFTGVRGGCNMQRVISLTPEHFSKSLIYHVANNKQRQLARQRMLRADHLLGQLNSVRKAAEKAKSQMQRD